MSTESYPRSGLPPAIEMWRQMQRNIDTVTTRVLWTAAGRLNKREHERELASSNGEDEWIKVSTWLCDDSTDLMLRIEYKGGHGLGSFSCDYYPREVVRGMVLRGPEVHEAIFKENGLDPKKQESSAYYADVFEECVLSTDRLFQNVVMQLVAALRCSHDNAIERTKAVTMHSLNRELKLAPSQSTEKKKSFVKKACSNAGKEASSLKRELLRDLFNHLSGPEEKLNTSVGRPEKTPGCKQQERGEYKEKIIKGILKLLAGNVNKLKRAQIVRTAGLYPEGSKGNATQALDDVLKRYDLNLEELIEEAKLKNK